MRFELQRVQYMPKVLEPGFSTLPRNTAPPPTCVRVVAGRRFVRRSDRRSGASRSDLGAFHSVHQ